MNVARLLAAPLLLHAVGANAQKLVPPEVVHLENVKTNAKIKTVYVGNANEHFVLYCNVKAVGCMTPGVNKNYLLFNADTRWKMPGAKRFLILAILQDWINKYIEGKTLALFLEMARATLEHIFSIRPVVATNEMAQMTADAILFT